MLAALFSQLAQITVVFLDKMDTDLSERMTGSFLKYHSSSQGAVSLPGQKFLMKEFEIYLLINLLIEAYSLSFCISKLLTWAP